ncbi:nucleotidyltransferase family protein [Demequina phytophila]|uniref:nucleotidyltransferase family protein n=1 Tax=Demequina phytophila TaxID=1638981 RepID=UPI0007860659|nr:nucleotidyltransferase family protein [Demequina phytophila]
MNAALAIADAVPLAHALAVDVARRAGIRALVIKGPSAAAHGLRAERVSADADVMVSPDGFDAYVDALRGCGWHERPAGDGMGPTAIHSVTLIHDGWPCDIDAHVQFPGFLAAPQHVFDELWQRRQPLALADVEVDMVDRSGAILIAALHALRTPSQTPRHVAEIRRLVDEVLPRLNDIARADVVALAITGGAADTARPVLDRLCVALPPVTPHGADPALDAWRARVGGRGETTAQWLVLISRANWRAKPGMVVRMMWPRESEFRRVHPEVPAGRGAAIRGRWARIVRGVRATPRALWGRVLARRGVTDASILDGDPR